MLASHIIQYVMLKSNCMFRFFLNCNFNAFKLAIANVLQIFFFCNTKGLSIYCCLYARLIGTILFLWYRIVIRSELKANLEESFIVVNVYLYACNCVAIYFDCFIWNVTETPLRPYPLHSSSFTSFFTFYFKVLLSSIFQFSCLLNNIKLYILLE